MKSKTVDILIVGGGVGGLYLANLLVDRGKAVCVCEAGGSVSNEIDLGKLSSTSESSMYKGLTLGRAFGLGGTSKLWGGQMIPLLESDLEARLKNQTKWPIGYFFLQKYYKKVSERLKIKLPDIDSNVYLRKVLLEKSPDPKYFNFTKRFSTWLPIRKRNFCKLFKKKLIDSDNCEIYERAALSSVLLTGDSDTPVKCIFANGKQTLTFKCKKIIIAAGAVESTRLLFTFFDDNRLATPNMLGKFFSDHISLKIAEIDRSDYYKNIIYNAPVINGQIFTPRYELKETAQKRGKFSSAFFHVISEIDGSSSVDIIRAVFLFFQGKPAGIKRIRLITLALLFRDIIIMLYWYVIKRKLIKPFSKNYIMLDIEQQPLESSFVEYRSETRSVSVHWSVSEYDIENATKVRDLLKEEFLRNGSELKPNFYKRITSSNIYDVYHPTGTIPFGSDSSKSVLDSKLRLWGYPFISVLSTAVFPAAGSANPGLTQLALAEYLGDVICE